MNIKLIAGGVAVFAAGVGVGALAARKYYSEVFSRIADEEIAEARKFYRTVLKEDYPTPSDAVEDLHGVEEAADAFLQYQSEATKGEVTVEPKTKGMGPVEQASVDEVISQNIFSDAYQLKMLDVGARDPHHPYVITLAEWEENKPEHRQVQLTYYGGDDIVANEDDHVMNQVDKILGKANLGKFGVGSDDETVVLIRNEAYGNDYEVTYSEGYYEREVLGHAAELEHSDEPRRRRHKRWDDE